MSENSFEEFEEKEEPNKKSIFHWTYLIFALLFVVFSFFASGALTLNVFERYFVISYVQTVLVLSFFNLAFWLWLEWLMSRNKSVSSLPILMHHACNVVLIFIMYRTLKTISSYNSSNTPSIEKILDLDDWFITELISFIVVQILFFFFVIWTTSKNS